MKNLLNLLLLAPLSVVFIGCSQTSFISGDKSLNDVKTSQAMFSEQIERYEDQISNLRSENSQLMDELSQDKPDQKTSDLYCRKISNNDSLIAVYQKRSDLLRGQIDDLLIRSAGSDQQHQLKLTGHDVSEMANAYVQISWANVITKADATNVAGASLVSSPLVGIVENLGYSKVNVKISGQNFIREYTLDPKGKSPIFNLPGQGNYTATFTNGYEIRTVTKPVGPNIVYFDGGKPYDFKATLLP